MILFHGSNVEVSSPHLMLQTRALDFGRAFYLTSDVDQASKWAQTSRALSCLRYREVVKA